MKTRIRQGDHQKPRRMTPDRAIPVRVADYASPGILDGQVHTDIQSTIHSSPRLVSQQLQIESAFGGVIQRRPLEEEEEEPLQGRFGTADVLQEKPALNRTGLPDELKAGVENLSSLSLDDVHVHYNSPQPARFQALAYTRGKEIHVAPGQERYLPHEAWHAVQQLQGRVRPTMQMKEGTLVNDDPDLEHEADAMGTQTLPESLGRNAFILPARRSSRSGAPPVMQMTMGWQQVVITLAEILAEHGLKAKYEEMWQSKDARRIAEEVGDLEDTDKSNVRRRLVAHQEIAPLLRPYRMKLEPSQVHAEPAEAETVDADQLNDVYQAFLSLLCYHASENAEAVRKTGLDPDWGGKEGGFSDKRSLLSKRQQNLAAAKGKVFVSRKYKEAKQYAEGKEDRIVMLIVPREFQDNIDKLGSRFEVDPDAQFGLVSTDYLKGVVSTDGTPNYWAISYLLKEMKNEDAKLNFSKLWEALRAQGRIKP